MYTTKQNSVTSKSNVNKFPAKSTNTYTNMCVLCRDLYYKSIVAAHADRIKSETEKQIADIMDRFKKDYISKREVFVELEALRSGYACTDLPVKGIIKEIRAKK